MANKKRKKKDMARILIEFAIKYGKKGFGLMISSNLKMWAAVICI